MDFRLREDAPINEEEWSQIDRTVHNVVRRQVVGRRVLSLFGPLGPGVQVVPTDRFHGYDMGQVGMTGNVDDPVALMGRLYQRVPMLHKDFVVYWRDIEMARATGMPMDWSMAEAAASYVAQAEDHLIFHGSKEQETEGLLTVNGRHVLPTPGWSEMGSGYQDVVRAVSHLSSAGFYPPFAVIVGTAGYAQWHRLFGHSGVMEVDQIRKLAEGGVYVSPLIPDGHALVVAHGAENLDLAVGLDVTVAFLESSAMNHFFRVLETLTLRIKRPGAICHLEPEIPKA